jgi:CRISPR-associated protein Cas1
MGWSADALSLRTPTVVELPRAADRISYLFLDRCKVWQDDTGLRAVLDDGAELNIPVASLTVLMLGPGCSITTPALTTMHRAGCSLAIVDGAGVSTTVPGRRLTSRARWSQAQATVWSDHSRRVSAAAALYDRRFGKGVVPPGTRIAAMRGIEGKRMRDAYRQHTKRTGQQGWRRATDGDDPVNPLLNLANSILYASALGAVSALGLNPALGFIHHGAADALLFDLADNHKTASSLPIAFDCALLAESDRTFELRRRMRTYLHRNDILEDHLRVLDLLLGDVVRTDAGDGPGDTLIDDSRGTSISGHTSHTQRDADDMPF